MDSRKLAKFIDHLQHFSVELELLRDFTVHQRINHFYYMQKQAEFVVLRERLEETQARLSWLTTFIEKEYACVYVRWSHDVRWLQAYRRIQK